MNATITSIIEGVYGPVAVPEIARALSQLVDRMRPLLPQGHGMPKPWPFSERDVLLISYADQLSEPGAPPLRTLADFADRHLRDLVSGIHLLPFFPASSDDGFSVMDYYAVDPANGSWEDVASLAQGFDLMFDAVLNHASAQGTWFRRFLADDPAFRDFFLTVPGDPCLSKVVRPRALPLLTEYQSSSGPRKVWTTFSADQADLNFKNPSVLLAALEVLLFYVSKGARFIRLDAIAFLWKEIGTSCLHLPQTHRLIQLIRAVLDEVAPWVQLVTETNVPHHDNISYFGDGTNEAQLVYNFALPPLVLHALQTGSAVKLTRWAQTLQLPSDRTSFLSFLASHDGIGLNPVRGILSDEEIELLVSRTLSAGGYVSYKSMADGSTLPYELNINYLDALSPPAGDESNETAARKFLTAHAMMLSLQGVPAVYFHSLAGSRGDPGAVRATGMKRRINREKLDRLSLERELAMPGSLRAMVFAGWAELLRMRRGHAAFAPAAGQRIPQLDPRVFAVLRETRDAADRVICLHNVSSERVTLGRGLLLHEALSLAPFDCRWLPVPG